MDHLRIPRSVVLRGGWAVKLERFDQPSQLSRRQIAPGAQRNAAYCEWTDANAPQPFDRYPRRLHHPPHDVRHPLVQVHPQPDAVAFFAQKANLVGNDQLAVQRYAISQSLERHVGRSLRRQDMIFLRQPKAGVHDAIGDFAIIRQEQQSLGDAVEPAHRVNALFDLDEIEHRPPIPLVAGSRDVAAWFVE
jgi:hypothetical protein